MNEKIYKKLKMIYGDNGIYGLKHSNGEAVLVDVMDDSKDRYESLYIIPKGKVRKYAVSKASLISIDDNGKYRVIMDDMTIADTEGENIALIDVKATENWLCINEESSIKATEYKDKIFIDAKENIIRKIVGYQHDDIASDYNKCMIVVRKKIIENTTDGNIDLNDCELYVEKLGKLSAVTKNNEFYKKLNYIRDRIEIESDKCEEVIIDGTDKDRVYKFGLNESEFGEEYGLNRFEKDILGLDAHKECSGAEIKDKLKYDITFESSGQEVDDVSCKYIKEWKIGCVTTYSVDDYLYSQEETKENRCIAVIDDGAELEIIDSDNEKKDNPKYKNKGKYNLVMMPEEEVYKAYKRKYNDFEYNYSGLFLNYIAGMYMIRHYKEYTGDSLDKAEINIVYKGKICRIKNREVNLLVKGNKVKMIFGYLPSIRMKEQMILKEGNNFMDIANLVIDDKDFEEYKQK